MKLACNTIDQSHQSRQMNLNWLNSVRCRQEFHIDGIIFEESFNDAMGQTILACIDHIQCERWCSELSHYTDGVLTI